MQPAKMIQENLLQPQLFVIYIGGDHKQSLIELHDMRFAVGNSIEDTYQRLRESWWGTPESLHLDAWGILNYADGYDIHISDKPAANHGKKLFFVNLGGYDQRQFTELHKNVFVVAEDEYQAKQKAVKEVSEWESPHRDYLHKIENIVNINELLNSNNYHIHLTNSNDVKPFEFICRYTPIGK